MIIQKQTSGDVWLVVNGVNTKTLSEKCTLNLSYKKAGIDVIDLQGRQYFIPLAQVQETQLLPAAALKFSGDLGDLWDLLVTSFFIELHIQSSSSGGVVIESEYQVTTPTHTITDAYKNYICTANTTLTLPQTNTGKYAFRVWAANGITVTVQGTGGDTVNGDASISIVGRSMVTLRNLLSFTDWSIGH